MLTSGSLEIAGGYFRYLDSNGRVTPTPSMTSVTPVQSLVDLSGVDLLSSSEGRRQVELMIKCTDLANLDTFSKSDPMCVMFIRQFGQWKEYGRTEAVRETTNPKFTQTFLVEFDREIHQQIMFSVYDIDSRATDLRFHDHVGSVEVDVTNLLQADQRNTTIRESLRVPGDPQSRGLIHITSEPVQPSRSRVTLHLGAAKLNRKRLSLSKHIDSFLEISRGVDSINFHPIHRTEVVHKTKHPRWRPLELSVQKLCNGDWDRPLQISCWQALSHNGSSLIGEARTTLRELTSNGEKSCQTLNLIHPKKLKVKGNNSSGKLKILKCLPDMAFTLLDYVRGGCSLNFMVAIDYTSSNGPVDSPTSLHYLQGSSDNQYIEALKTVGAMLSQYDRDQQFPAFGFGARLKPRSYVSDCFFLNDRTDDPYVKGLQGVIESYRRITPKVTLSGPSRVASVIKSAQELVSKKLLSQQDQFYHVLMIITDGVINDIDQTINQLVKGSDLPLSVVFIGIGPADFSMMEYICTSLSQPAKSVFKSTTACRENTHFAAFRKQKYVTGANTTIAKETLAKLSQQAVNYLKNKMISPNKPREDSMANFVESTASSRDTLDLPLECSLTTGRRKSLSETTTRSNKFTNATGPSCPTCGALIEEGKAASETSSIATLSVAGITINVSRS